ncbi:MAG: GFA family protein, partial [Marinicaulis sp.]|nr:GFA family protein [Marinicaulis sp.]
MPVPFEGGCHCGAVRYKCQVKPQYTFYCHCNDCQRTTGSPFSMELMVERAATEIRGRLNQYEITGDSGKPVKRHFCPACGSG